jgi:carboxylesterase
MQPDFYDPIFLKGNRNIGVLMIHGFTGTPKSVEPWAQGLNKKGFTVYVPLLAGHASDWREMARHDWGDWLQSAEEALSDLEQQVDEVFVAGFSMGGTIATRLTQLFPGRISGVILLNPTIYDNHIRMIASRFLAWLIPSIKAEGTDVAKSDPIITSQQRVSLRAANSLHKFRHIVRRDLPLIKTPMKIFLSVNDNVVPYSNGLLISNSVRSERNEIHFFEKSFHVVPQDYENEELVEASTDFLYSLSPVQI